jgi:hypothetical protein
VRTPLTDLDESEIGQDGGNLARLEDWYVPHRLGDLDRLRPHELTLESRSAVLEQHCDHFLEVLP